MSSGNQLRARELRTLAKGLRTKVEDAKAGHAIERDNLDVSDKRLTSRKVLDGLLNDMYPEGRDE